MKRVIINILAWIGNKRATQIRMCRLVKMCFNDVDWSVQTFTTTGGFIEDKRGNKHFYATADIDGAIKKLNKVLSRLG